MCGEQGHKPPENAAAYLTPIIRSFYAQIWQHDRDNNTLAGKQTLLEASFSAGLRMPYPDPKKMRGLVEIMVVTNIYAVPYSPGHPEDWMNWLALSLGYPR